VIRQFDTGNIRRPVNGRHFPFKATITILVNISNDLPDIADCRVRALSLNGSRHGFLTTRRTNSLRNSAITFGIDKPSSSDATDEESATETAKATPHQNSAPNFWASRSTLFT
jgi:hypothetical protein